MLSPEKINIYNSTILERLSQFLNYNADFIQRNMIEELVNECNMTQEEAFALLLADVCGFDIGNNLDDRQLFDHYFPYMVSHLDETEYKNNLYYKNIKIPEIKVGRWEFKQERYKAYEAFVYDDLHGIEDGRIFPQIGFFEDEFTYPVVLEDNREWMLITPNEIETMKSAIHGAFGKVLTYGLGLGYYAYMVSEKEDVVSVTIVEKDRDVINLFEDYILPQFVHRDKIRIIEDDAYHYAKNDMADEDYDVVFTDLWHDPSDGVDMYLEMKRYEQLNPRSNYMYWIEKTILCYM